MNDHVSLNLVGKGLQHDATLECGTKVFTEYTRTGSTDSLGWQTLSRTDLLYRFDTMPCKQKNITPKYLFV